MKHLHRVFCSHSILLCAVAWMFCNPVVVHAKAQKSVLLFYDSRSDMQGNVLVDRTIRAVLTPEFNLDLDIRSEYFELSAVTESDYPLLSAWLRRKYAETRFDVVVAVGMNALRFVRENGDLFPGAQFVFWGRRTGLDDWGSELPITGVVAPTMESHIRSAFQFICTLQPDLQQLVVVSGRSEFDRDWEVAARTELPPLAAGVTLTYLSALSVEDLQNRLINLPKKTAVLFLTINEDASGRRLFTSDVLDKIAKEAAAPVYGTSAIRLNTGIVGGALVDQETMSREAAGLIARLLRGENIQEMPVRESAPVPMVDWRVLRRWDIPEDRLPSGTVVMYKDQSLWSQYKWQIMAGAFLCALEAVLIVVLLANRANRRRAEKTMRQTQRLLQSSIDALDARVALLDEDGGIIAVNEPWHTFASANGHEQHDVGRNYLEACEGGTTEEARVVSDGIRRLLSGELGDFRCIYPSASEETSWFQVCITRFHIDGVLRLVVTHENVTEIKQAHDTQQQLSGLLLRAQDDERRRIARDLHDVTVQNLAAIRGNLTRIERTSGADHSVQGILEENVSLCDRVIQELRTLSYVLHPPLLDEVGLTAALQWFVRGFTQRSGIKVEFLIMEDIGRLGTDIEIALFRVVQECLTNVHRHSGSRSAVVWVTKEEDTVRVQITDEGHGFPVRKILGDQQPALAIGVGILGMRQRLKQLGGDLEIESSSQGTTVTAKIAIPQVRHATHSIS